MVLHLYDTRHREKVPFKTIHPGKVSMYVCGVTVYDRCHLGHARCYIAFDVIYRWLKQSGYDVTYVQNFTDIDDKIINRAQTEQRDWREIVDENIEAYYNDMDRLNIQRANHYPRCTDYVEHMIGIIDVLIDKGHAYVASDGVYFHVESAPEKYGQLTGQSIEAVRSGASGRVEDQSGKKDHKDFALWKAAKPGEPTWDSPWGPGRPGWHIECTAMSLDHFLNEFDIHGGGHDLRFPHHEAEIFQGECYTDHSPVVHHWMHNGFVNIDGEKMSKSLGNFWTIDEILAKVDPLVLRFALINAHYRSPIDMNESLLKDAERNYAKLIDVYETMVKQLGQGEPVNLPHPDTASTQPLSKGLGMLELMGEHFAKAMDDDFNTREAIAKVLTALREMSKILDAGLEESDAHAFAHYCVEWLEETAGTVLGLLPQREEVLRVKTDPRRAAIAEQVEHLLEKRAEARASKDYATADAIRDELASLNVIVTDTADGPVWELR
jgi:cysteinyl-tRNA synthetase